MKQYRVIVWGLGNVGKVAVKMCMEKSELKIVGAIDVDSSKVGKDVGEIFGYGRAGVTVSSDVDKIFATDADVILCYTPLIRDEKGGFMPSARDIVRALKAKKNVITTIPISYPEVSSPDVYALIDQVARENGVTFAPSGLLPGAYASYIPTVLSGLMGRVDSVLIESGEDDQHNNSSWVKVFGYGADPKAFPCDKLKYGIVTYYRDGVYEVGAKLGFKISELSSRHDVFTAPEDLKVAWGIVPKGTIAGHRFTISGLEDGIERVTLRYIHKVCDDKMKEPMIADRIHIEGWPKALDLQLSGMMPLDDSYVTSAAPSVNIIPQVVEAEPGFKHALDLPVIHSLAAK
jgi:hypothetical protein